LLETTHGRSPAANGERAQLRNSHSSPSLSSAAMRTEASSEKPPPCCHPSIARIRLQLPTCLPFVVEQILDDGYWPESFSLLLHALHERCNVFAATPLSSGNVIVHRTQILLEDEQYKELKKESQTTGESLSAIIRGCVTEHLRAARQDPLLDLVGSVASEGDAAPSDLGEHHDDYLYSEDP
jgi:hypothetical protein